MIIHGECLEEMKKMADKSVDFIVTDPPYGISLGNFGWDKNLPSIDVWKEALRICKPGSMMAVFGSPKTHHRLMCSIEDSGWEISDVMMWIYGEGWPIGAKYYGIEGYASCLKPAWEPIILARKKFKTTFKKNVEMYGIAGMNIEKCRIPRLEHELNKTRPNTKHSSKSCLFKSNPRTICKLNNKRWPANLIFDHESKDILDEQTSNKQVSRFFYCAKQRQAKTPEFIHPTQKPLDLMKYIITLVAPPNDPICLDPFAGSGTTLVACNDLGIRSIGIEMNEEYVKICQKRLQKEV